MTIQEYVNKVLSDLGALNEYKDTPSWRTVDPIVSKLKDIKIGIGPLYELNASLFAAFSLAYPQKYTIKNYDILCYCLQNKADIDKNINFRLFLLDEIIAVTNRDDIRSIAISIKEYLEKKRLEDTFYGLSPEALKYFTNPNDFNSFWTVSKVRRSSKSLSICKVEENCVVVKISTISDTSDGIFEYVDCSNEDSSITLTFSEIRKIILTNFNLEDTPSYGLTFDYRIIQNDDCLLFEVSDCWQPGDKRISLLIEAKKVTCSELSISQI